MLGSKLPASSRRTGARGAFSVTAIAIVACASAKAQTVEAGTPAADDEIRLTAVTVSAQRREQSVRDVGAAVQAFSAEEISSQQIASLADVANAVPGLVFGENSGSGAISLRGIGLSTISGDGEQSTTVNLDGIYLPRAKSLLMVQDDLAGIEVVKGPQSTFYGKNSLGGVINLISPSPRKEFGGEARLLIGDYNTRRYFGAITGGTDKIRGRLSLSYDERDGYIDNLTTGEKNALDGLEGTSARVAIDATLSESATLELRGTYRDDKSTGPIINSYDPDFIFGKFILSSFGVNPADYVALDPYETRTLTPSLSQRELFVGSAAFKVDLGFASLTARTGYTEFDWSRRGDGFGNDFDLGPLFGSPVPIPFSVAQRVEENRTFSQEFLLSGNQDRLDWIVGAYYLNQKDDVDSNVTLTPAVTVISTSQDELEHISVFGDLKYSVTPTTRVVGGLRYMDEKLNHALFQNLIGAGGVTCTAATVDTNDVSEVTGRFGFESDLRPGALLYGTYSKGYKSGGYGTNQCSDFYKPEHMDAFELGAKTSWLNGRVFLDVATFYYKLKDLQVEANVPTGVDFLNAPQSEVLGLDLSLNALVTDRFSLNAALSLLEAEYTEFTALNSNQIANGLVVAGTSLKGNALNRSPGYTLNLSAEYVHPLEAAGTLAFRVTTSIVDDFALAELDVPLLWQNGYTMTNLFVTWTHASGDYSVRAFAKNIEDEPVVGGIITTSLGGTAASFGPPRTVGVELTARF